MQAVYLRVQRGEPVSRSVNYYSAPEDAMESPAAHGAVGQNGPELRIESAHNPRQICAKSYQINSGQKETKEHNVKSLALSHQFYGWFDSRPGSTLPRPATTNSL
jgi:hypothetical protein